MSTDKYSKLEELAKLATPSPYKLTSSMDYWIETNTGVGIALYGDLDWLGHEEVICDQKQMKCNAQYAVATSPETILELIKENRELTRKYNLVLDTIIHYTINS